MMPILEKIYSLLNKGPVRVLSLLLALILAAAVLWDPTLFAAKTSSFAIWQSLAIIWAVCAGIVHGVGFTPRRLIWQILFCPLPAMVILLLGLAHIMQVIWW